MDELLTAKGLKLNPENPDFLIFTPSVETYREGYQSVYGAVDFSKAMLRISFVHPSSKVSIYEAAAAAYADVP